MLLNNNLCRFKINKKYLITTKKDLLNINTFIIKNKYICFDVK